MNGAASAHMQNLRTHINFATAHFYSLLWSLWWGDHKFLDFLRNYWSINTIKTSSNQRHHGDSFKNAESLHQEIKRKQNQVANLPHRVDWFGCDCPAKHWANLLSSSDEIVARKHSFQSTSPHSANHYKIWVCRKEGASNRYSSSTRPIDAWQWNDESLCGE